MITLPSLAQCKYGYNSVGQVAVMKLVLFSGNISIDKRT